MSKKIAAGADAIVLDVKTGEGAFMKTLADAEALAHTMVKIGHQVGRKTLAVISDMSQPLGYMIGNALEVKEAIQTLQGQGPEDLTELCLVLGGQMLLAANRVASLEEGKALLQEQIDSGRALEVFKTFLANQGGDTRIVDNPDLLPQARYQIPLLAQSSGVVSQWVADEVGVAAMMLGAGRETKEDIIDPAVGIELCAKVGDPIQEGQPLAILHSNREDVSEVLARLSAAISIADSAQVPELIRKVIVE